MKQKGSFDYIQFLFDKDPKTLFSYQELILGTVYFEAEILLCLVGYEKADALAKDWKNLNSFLTAKVVGTVGDEFARWNFYVIYVCREEVGKELKYEIENNKFASRKIVQDNFGKILDGEGISYLISEHITNDNIKLKPQEVKKEAFKKDKRFSSIISSQKMEKKKGADGEDPLVNILDRIEKKL